jgi:2'-5' RNA ligase
MEKRWRLFVAIPIGEDLRRNLAEALEAARAAPGLEDLRWTDPDDWHLTLAFLGDTDPAEVPRLARSLAAVADAHPPMAVPAGGLGAFPGPRRARVAWYGVADPDGRLARLAEAVREAVGAETGSPFRAHLTLARARHEPLDLRDWIASTSVPRGRLTVDTVQLLRSHLGRGPARYEVLETLLLGAPAHV